MWGKSRPTHPLVPKLSLGTHLSPKLCFLLPYSVHPSRYFVSINEFATSQFLNFPVAAS